MKNESMTTIKQVFHFIGLFALVLLFWAAHLSAADHESVNQDWPQWRGPNRDAISHETDLLKSWGTTGPKETWRIPIGDGFSAISISQGRAYTMEAKGDDEFVVCFSADTGEEIWRFRSDAFYHEGMGGDGPRATPTIVDDMLFTVSAYGKLYALHANTGEKLWSYDFQKDFGSKMPQWGYSMSPLVYGEKLLVEVGGKEEKSIIAFDKKSGELLWTSQEDVAGYSSPISVTIHDIHQLIFFTGRKLVALSPEDGRLYWQYRWETSYDVNAATPVFIPPDKVFISSGYDKGAAVVQIRVFTSPGDRTAPAVQIKENRGSISVKEIWKSRVMKNHFGSSVFHDDYLYGFDNGILKCIEANTGQTQWKKRGFGKGTLIFADAHLIILGEKGKLALALATPEGYFEVANAQVLKGRCWTIPTLASGKLYLRNDREMVCLDVKGMTEQVGDND